MADDGEISGWDRYPPAIELQRFDSEGRSSRIVRHTSSPFVEVTDTLDDAALQGFADRYLQALTSHLDTADDYLPVPTEWTKELNSKQLSNAPMRWLEVWPRLPGAESEPEAQRPRLASWTLTHKPVPDSTLEVENKSVVMVASETIPVTVRSTLSYGLSVPVSLTPRAESAGGYVMQIRSMTAEIPRSPYRSFTEVQAHLSDESRESLGVEVKAMADAAKDSIGQIARRLQLEPDFGFEDFRARWRDVDGQAIFDGGDLTGIARSALSRRPTAEGYGFLVRFARRDDGDFTIVALSKHPLTSHAGIAEVFRQDPASGHPDSMVGMSAHEHEWTRRRPTRREEVLQRYRVPANIPATLEEPGFKVRNCPYYVRGDPSSFAAKTVALPTGTWPEVRRDAFSAISAYDNCRRFFKMLENFGFDWEFLTPVAEDKVQVFYRSGMTRGPGRDGQTINARVSLVPRTDDLPLIEMHLALGNLSHRGRWPTGATAAWAEPLGIAASPRWVWHEFGHVLIGAKFGHLGHLEFGFAHSAGDGLAAVMGDPFSRLADPRTGLGLRGYTFPWVFATRRHDRSVTLGWAWNGSLNQGLINAPSQQRLGYKAYVSEQILSSTLFRLYRILGGDTVRPGDRPNLAMRERASLLVQFLVIKAIWSLSSNPEQADIFELAVENADISQSALDFGPLSELDAPVGAVTDIWRGGQAHKVVRWAFEAQGMFGPTDQGYRNAPGLPPEVDVYIPDGRPNTEMAGGGSILHGRGGYVPVSLHWSGTPSWHATDGLSLTGGKLRMTVGNRGSLPAGTLKLRVWVGKLTGQPSNPNWDLRNRITWAFSVGPTDLQTLQPGEIGNFEIDLPPGQVIPTSPFVLLVEVSCLEDRANSDPAAGFACAISGMPPRVPRHLADLVANDNNLAIRIL